MDVAVLFSGGADSALAARLLEPHCSITLISCRFDTTREPPVREAATALDLPLDIVELEDSVLDAAVEMAVADGFPRNAIQAIHEHALETVAAREYDFVADGTRRDDRTPTVPRDVAQRIEDTYDVGHLAPLAGIGHRAVKTLQASLLDVETGPSEALPIGDYEAELRGAMATEYGREWVGDIFPDHEQSRVVGRDES